MELADLGSSVVLDAHNMYEGMYVSIDAGGRKKTLVISKIVDDTKIILRPLTKWESTKLWFRDHKVLATISLVILLVLGIMVVRSLKG